MGRDELAKHKFSEHGRNYALSCDGYEDMGVAEKQGWSAVANWGRDGWDLGEWPYVVMYTRTTSGRFEPHPTEGRWELQQITEGDHTLYRFVTEADREAAMDYLFLWYAAGKHWAPLRYEDREQLDAGGFEVDPEVPRAVQDLAAFGPHRLARWGAMPC
jgi:hypothetical protein